MSLLSRITLFLLCLIASTFLFSHNLPPGFASVRIADELDPVAMALSPDGRIFLTEKNGRILIIENGQLKPDPFLEIEVDNFNERGLTGIAIDPDFETNHYVYVYYTVPNANYNRVSRFTADGNFAVPNSEQILFELDLLNGPHHNAGAMVFGLDEKLYVAVGDGTNLQNSQDMNTVLGKILRINKDGSIPEDNPFYTTATGKNKAIWALGLRNPFAMNIQPGTGKIFSTDVGGSFFEEVNQILKGKNYGWPNVEGYLANGTPPANYQDPLYAYGRSKGCAAVGVTTYDPDILMFPPEYEGKIFFSEYCFGKIHMLDPITGETSVFASDIQRPLNLLTAPDGTLYFIARAGMGGGSASDNTSTSNGSIWRVFYTGSDAPFISVQPKNVNTAVTENASFFTAASGAAPLSFQWQMNGTDIPGANSPNLLYENVALSDSGNVFRCIVSNLKGSDTTLQAVLNVIDGHRPEPIITFPEDGYLYRGGDAMIFSGQVYDEDEGFLPPENFKWKIDFHHNDHSHPGYGPVSGIEGDTFFIPKIGEVSHNVWYRINLTATDATGLSQTAQKLVYPVKTDFTLKTSPPGLPIDTDGNLSATPYSVTSVVGVIHDVKAPKTQLSGDSLYVFKEWNTGVNNNEFLFDPPDQPVTLIAYYEAIMALSDGQGLKAYYYDDVEKNNTFVEPFAFSQVDPLIQFDWEGDSPDEEYLGKDHFLVRWEGSIKPFFDDTLNFHVITDDGMRLWVNDQLILDEWYPQGKTEHSASIILEGDKLYPVKLEYFESYGDAIIQLLWSSQKVERGFIPTSQLFPFVQKDTYASDLIQFEFYPNPVSKELLFEITSPVATSIHFDFINTQGQIVQADLKQIPLGKNEVGLDVSNLPVGIYYVKLQGDLLSETIRIIKSF